MAAHMKVILLLLLLLCLTETVSGAADLTKLVERLNSKKWPWFGDRYSHRCPKPKENWPKCYNPRDDKVDSVLPRVGVHSDFKATYELEVIFSAPEEMVDVCGKSVSMPKVEPFKLNPNGFAIPDLLKKGAEIYRRMPIVKWTGTLDEEHSLLVLDSGFIKVRGYIGNVRTNGTHLLGEVLWPYTPPANPHAYRNPIVILLIKETLRASTYNQQQMESRSCIVRGISKTKLRDCMDYFMDILGAAKVKAVQVFYTDGTSKYERYRACLEGTFCHSECIDSFKSYAAKKGATFLAAQALLIDMYVNLDVMTTRRFNYTACCNFVIVDTYTFRGVPGDDNMADDTAKLHQPYRLEFSGSGAMGLDEDTLYSVLMVDIDAVYPEAKVLPYGHLWTANIKYQDQQGTGTPIMTYAGPTPPDNAEHTYFILLFSHTKAVEAFPTDFYKDIPGCEKRCMWDLSKLPSDFRLRGMTWYRAKTDNYILQLMAGNTGAPCATTAQGPPSFNSVQSCSPRVVSYDSIPQMAILLTYEGNLIESADPDNPDFDYDNAGLAAANGGRSSPDNYGTLEFILFCFWVSEAIRV